MTMMEAYLLIFFTTFSGIDFIFQFLDNAQLHTSKA